MDQVDPTASATPEAATSFELTKFERCRVAFRTLLSRAHFRSGESSRRTCIFAGVHLVDVQPSGGFRLWCKFNDGMEGVVDLLRYRSRSLLPQMGNRTRLLRIRGDRWGCPALGRVHRRLLRLGPGAPSGVAEGSRAGRDLGATAPEYRGRPVWSSPRPWMGSAWGACSPTGRRASRTSPPGSMNGKFERWRTEEGFFGTVKAKGWGLVWDEWVEITADCVYERIVGRRGRDGSA